MNITIGPIVSRRVQRILDRVGFDIVHIHEPLLPGTALAALYSTRGLEVGTFHAFPYHERWSLPALAYWFAALMLRTSFHQLDGRIALSPVAARFISRFFSADYQVIPSGIDSGRFHPQIVSSLQWTDDKYNILFVGRFDRRKGTEYLIEAIPRICTLHMTTRFLFVGMVPSDRVFNHSFSNKAGRMRSSLALFRQRCCLATLQVPTSSARQPLAEKARG